MAVTTAIPGVGEPLRDLIRARAAQEEDLADVLKVDLLYADSRRPTPYREPHILMEVAGGPQVVEDNRMSRSRAIFTIHGRTWTETRVISRWLHDVFLPPDDVASGLYEKVDGVRFSGANEDSPPQEAPSDRNEPEIRQSYMVLYYRED